MPAVRLTVFKHYAFLISSIALNGEIISPCSYYLKKGLVCVIITNLSSYQLFSYSKCTKLNTYALYNVRSVLFNKYAFLTYFNSH